VSCGCWSGGGGRSSGCGGASDNGYPGLGRLGTGQLDLRFIGRWKDRPAGWWNAPTRLRYLGIRFTRTGSFDGLITYLILVGSKLLKEQASTNI